MTEPGDEITGGAPGLGYLRASHAERERVIVLLKAAFVQGRLAKDEFELRVGWALAARTWAELAAVTADIPAGLMRAQLPRPARDRGSDKVAGPVLGAFAAWLSIVVAASFWAGENGPAQQSLGVVSVVVLLYASLVSFCLIAVWLERRASRRSARGLLPGGARIPAPVSADWARQPARQDLRLAGGVAPPAAGQAVVTVTGTITVSAGVFAPGWLTEQTRIVLPWKEGLYFRKVLGLLPEDPAGSPG
jgi:hypothetical protein